jgi:hypothetical protein
VGRGNLLSDRDARRVARLLWEAQRNTAANYPVRRKAGGGGGTAKKYAKILRGLRRADPAAEPDPITALTCYKMKLLSEAEYDAWSAAHGTYAVGDRVKYEDPEGVFLDYECILEHTAAAGKEPTEETWWEVHSPDAFILGYDYSSDLTQTCPWFQIDDELEVVQRSEVWYLLATVSKVEKVTGASLYTSIQWNDTDKRAMSVYK